MIISKIKYDKMNINYEEPEIVVLENKHSLQKQISYFKFTRAYSQSILRHCLIYWNMYVITISNEYNKT